MAKKPTILLTNDDGVGAEGIRALEEAIKPLTDNLWVVAPLQEMSATSHALSLRTPIRFNQLGERRFAVVGTPADCVILALNKLMPTLPDLTISGINRGGNMGENVFYSGTLAAAFESMLNRVPAFGISVSSRTEFNYDVAAPFAARLTEKLLQDMEPIKSGTLLNVNVPHPWKNGVRITRQSRKVTKNLLKEGRDPRGQPYFWIHEEIDLTRIQPDTDYAAILDGAISVTPMRIDRTEGSAIGRLTDWLADLDGFAPSRSDQASTATD